ncbi:MAG: GNAT family N-acetyltransferase [Thermodesulfobacteriota bacterium]|nr:MAG: GNAT family N-acetyltransferase [Thermodesulfobacteriota bacterium]
MNALLIRKLEKGDAKDVSRIFAAITKTKASINCMQVLEEQAEREEDVSFVAELEGKVVGFMISDIISGGYGLLNKSAWIVLFGVDPEFMGQGIGKKLAQEIYKVCVEKGIKNIYTTVRWDATDLLSFFKTLGFDRSNFINLEKSLNT